MQFFKSFTALILSACLLFSAANAFAQNINEAGAAEQELATQFPAQSIDSVERARAALALVPVARAEIDRRIAYQRAKCYEEFFTSSCLNDLRDRERRANRAVRRVEVEANALLRRERAAERDRAVADRERRAAEQRAGLVDEQQDRVLETEQLGEAAVYRGRAALAPFGVAR